MSLPPKVRSNPEFNVSLLANETLSDEPEYLIYFTNIYRTIYVVGLLGNLFALAVWACSGLRFAPVVYFQAICVADSLMLLLHPLENFHAVHLPGVCQLVHVLFLAVQVFAIFLVLGLSVERFIDLVHPLSGETLVTYKRTVRCIVLLALSAVLCSSLEGYVWHVQEDVGECQLRHTTTDGFIWIYATVVLALLFVCPLVIVLVVNALTHYKVKRKRKSSVAFSIAMVPDRHRLTRSVAILSCYLAICEIIYAGVHTHQYFLVDVRKSESSSTKGGTSRMPLTGRWHSYHLHSLPLLVIDVITLTSYAVDVAIFTLFSKTFRRKARELYNRCKLKCSNMRRHHHPPVFSTNGHVA